MSPRSTEKMHSAGPHGASSLGGCTKDQNALGFIRLRRGLSWPGVVGIDFIEDDIETRMAFPTCGKETGMENSQENVILESGFSDSDEAS